MKFSKIKETCIYIQDIELAKSFYGEKLGLEIISEVADKHIFFRAGTSVLLCFNPLDSKAKDTPPPHYGKGPLHFAFEVSQEEYSQSKKEIEQLGIEIIDEVEWSKNLKSFYFKDPAGNILEILPKGVWD